MSVEWSGLSPDLLLVLDRGSSEPLRVQLESQIRDAIRTGRLGVGERLPSSRELARELGLSRGLVQECYVQLQAEGYLVSQIGSATRVAAHAAVCPQPDEAAATEPPRLLADFRSGVPDLGSFPLPDWMWAMREAGRAVPTADLDYGDPRGSARLRTVLAGYLRRVRAAAAEPERILICSGFAQGQALTLRALAQIGVRRVAYEDPGSPAMTSAAAEWAGLESVPVPVDDQGVDVAALEAGGARAVIVTPAHQWPSGVVLTPERRRALIAWAARRDGYIVEDDYDAEFRYDREPVGALQGLAPDRVISIGTVSKSLVPALRTGWLMAPPALADHIVTGKHITDRGAPALEQLTLARLIESGRYDRHLRRMRGVYAGRRTALMDALAVHAPGIRVTGLAAGFHAVAHLPPEADEAEIVAQARARSVGLYGMSAFRSDRSAGPPQLVLGFGNLNDRAITAGIAAIADLL